MATRKYTCQTFVIIEYHCLSLYNYKNKPNLAVYMSWYREEH